MGLPLSELGSPELRVLSHGASGVGMSLPQLLTAAPHCSLDSASGLFRQPSGFYAVVGSCCAEC